MKSVIRFIIICLLFFSPIALYYSLKTFWLLKDDKYKLSIHGSEVYHAIDKSKKKTTYKKLILGDSTAKQFYDSEEKDTADFYALCCSQAIGIIGQYFLLNNYLNAGNRPDTVYLVYNPLSFADNLDQVYTYHYFLKPFYRSEYKPLFTQCARYQIHKIPKYWACQFPYILTSGWAPLIEQEQRGYSFISPVSREYLQKIDSLSYHYHFVFKILPSLTAEHWKSRIKSFNHQEFADYRFKDKLSAYLNQITYLPDSCFIDSVHLKSPELYRQAIDRKLRLR